MTNQEVLDEMYQTLWTNSPESVLEEIDANFPPVNPLDFLQTSRCRPINKDMKVLDIGTGLGKHAFIIGEKYGCHVTGIDLCQSNLSVAKEIAIRSKYKNLFEFIFMDMHDLKFASNYFDIIIIRDVLLHATDLERIFHECRRVLKPKGCAIVYTTFEKKEAKNIELYNMCSILNIDVRNIDESYFIKCFQNAGFIIKYFEEIYGQWPEFNEEKYNQSSKYLMRLSKINRRKDEYISIIGQRSLDYIISNYTWHIYMLMGKLSSSVFNLEIL